VTAVSESVALIRESCPLCAHNARPIL